MPLWSSSLAQDTMEYEFESIETVSPLEFGIHDNIILNSTDGAPLADAGFRLLLEEQIEKRPTWLSPDDQANCFANNEGWWLRHNKSSDGTKFWDEMLVAIGDLAGTSATTGLGVGQITHVSFEGLTTGSQNNAPTYSVASDGTLATGFVQVVWNEPIDLEVDTLPTLVVTNTRISNGTVASYTATAHAGNTSVNTVEPVGTDFDTLLMNSTDGAPGADAGDRIFLEDSDDVASANYKAKFQLETQRSGTKMNFFFTIQGSDQAGKLSVGRQAITLNSSTIKELDDTEASDSGIMQQVAAEVIEATTVIT